MEKSSQKELLATIGKQNEQIKRYETRLRDVVIAYKGLVKEKEALEASVKALSVSNVTNNVQTQPATKQKTGNGQDDEDTSKKTGEGVAEIDTGNEQEEETVEQLRQQLTTLMNSLATLSAEKSRMEASFQADKKQLRLEKEEREKSIKELQEKGLQASNDIENLKSKLILERHERDKEQSDHGVMIRELQKLLSEERRQKEHAENQLEELQTKLSQTEQQSGQYDKRLRDVRNELEATRRKLKRAEVEVKAKETPPLLLELQEEMASLKRHHQAAILQEQKRAADAEERTRKLAAMDEERVANLEARLAELSETVGSYDRLRQQDQLAIMKLKEHIAQLDLEHSAMVCVSSKMQPIGFEEERKEKSEADLSMDLQALVEEILALKSQLIMANQRADKPIDVHEVLCDESCPDKHEMCHMELERLQQELEWHKKQKLQQPNNLRDDSDSQALINTLKERIRVLNLQMDEKEEHKRKLEHVQKLLKAEQMHSKSELAACENDYRSRIAILEQQLLKQRERTLKLLEDKDQDIRMLKSTFGMFLPGNNTHVNNAEEHLETVVGGTDDVLTNLSQFSLGPTGGGESPHMLHYVHELARRDVEISSLRKANHKLESSVRELQRMATTEQEHHRERVHELREEIARLERCKSREGANLEYLKNVVLSFLLSSDPNCKRHMMNAIAAVLKFSSYELEKVNRTHNTN